MLIIRPVKTWWEMMAKDRVVEGSSCADFIYSL